MSRPSALASGRGTFVLATILLLVTAARAPGAEVAPADTVRTNIWLIEALMEDIVAASAQVLPAPPVRILLATEGADPETELFTGVAFRQLEARGYELYMPVVEEDSIPAHDVRYGYRVAGVDLSFPEVGRTLGLWRSWVGREIEAAVHLQITEAPSGRVLVSRRVSRAFSDRVPSGDFDTVNSTLYPFTSAETDESGWQRRLEEIVVLGALVGLVVIYFANTTN